MSSHCTLIAQVFVDRLVWVLANGSRVIAHGVLPDLAALRTQQLVSGAITVRLAPGLTGSRTAAQITEAAARYEWTIDIAVVSEISALKLG